MNREEQTRKDAVQDFEANLEGMDLNYLEEQEGRGDKLCLEAYRKREGRKKLAIMILAVIGSLGAAIGILLLLGPWSFLGLVSILVAYPFFKSKLKAEDFYLWEVRIPGQTFNTPRGKVTTEERTFRRWRITPAVWDYLHMEGEPFTLGDNVYLCNYFDPSSGYVGFAYMKTHSNLLRYYDCIWNWMIKTVPKLMENLALMKEGDKLRATKAAVLMLVKIGRLEPLYLEGKRIQERKLAQKGPGAV
jgi:hypothetical protein